MGVPQMYSCPNCDANGRAISRGYFHVYECSVCDGRFCYKCPASYNGHYCPRCGHKGGRDAYFKEVGTIYHA